MIKTIVIILIALFTITAFANTNLNMFLVRYVQISTPGGVIKANNYKLKTYTLIRWSSFMGRKVMMNKLTIPSLKCVEKRIKVQCTDDDYKVNSISGWRDSDTIKGNETSDHIYGTAIDLNINENPCCGCTKKWQESPRCTGEGVIEHNHGPKTGRYDLPQCWIEAFKAESWFWYGDDTSLRDTMHFSFIGTPGQGCQ